MAKPLKTKEILKYLIKNHSSGNTVYSQREIARTLCVSQPTVQKISTAFNAYLSVEGHSAEDFQDKDETELARMLSVDSKSDKTPCDSDFELLLELLEEPGKNASNILESMQADLEKKSADTCQYYWEETENITSLLTDEGRNFIKECNYTTFISNLHRFCTRKDYSNRLEFKPAEYLEIGVLPYKFRKNTSEEAELTGTDRQPLEEMGRFLFYAYLPFSRYVSITIIDAREDYYSNKIITSLILFLRPLEGLPIKIIGEDRIEEVFKGAELKPLRAYFDFCKVMYSSNRKHCSFKEREKKLIERIRDSLDPKKHKDKDERIKSQDRINRECMTHNNEESVDVALQREILKMTRNVYPDKYFVHDLKEANRQKNCHVSFLGHWYSCRYTCATPLLAFEFTDEGINLIMKQQFQNKEEIVSRHPLYSKERDGLSSYSTKAEDLPPNDKEAEDNNLWTRKKLLRSIGHTFNTMIDKNGELVPDPDNNVNRVVNAYVNSRKFPQQAFKLLDTICRKKREDIEVIRIGCGKLINELNSKSFPSYFADLAMKTYKSSIMNDEPSFYDNEEPEA